jgi:hypothetical protein
MAGKRLENGSMIEKSPLFGHQILRLFVQMTNYRIAFAQFFAGPRRNLGNLGVPSLAEN